MAILVLAFALQSCTRAVDVPFDDPDSIDPSATYKVITTDGREFMAKQLVLAKESVSFYAEKRDYTFARNEIKTIQKVEYNRSRTAIALTVVAAVVVGLVVLVGEMVESLGGD